MASVSPANACGRGAGRTGSGRGWTTLRPAVRAGAGPLLSAPARLHSLLHWGPLPCLPPASRRLPIHLEEGGVLAVVQGAQEGAQVRQAVDD